MNSTTPPLQERRDAWQKCGVSITVAGQSAQLPDIKEVRPEYRDIHSQVLQDVLTRLDRAFQAFFRRVKKGETPGYPRFQGANRYNSFTYKQFGNGAHAGQRLPRPVQDRAHCRPLVPPMEGAPKTVTISREADGWYVCFSCAEYQCSPCPPTGQETGIDLGMEAFATLSDGVHIFHPGWYRKAERALKTAQRRVSRRKKGSNRTQQSGQLLAKAHQKVKRSGRTFTIRRRSLWFSSNDTIYHEDLRVRQHAQEPPPCKEHPDAGWAHFLSILDLKAASLVGAQQTGTSEETSQICSGVGRFLRTGISVGWHYCLELWDIEESGPAIRCETAEMLIAEQTFERT